MSTADRDDVRDDGFQVAQDFGGGDAQGAEAEGEQGSIAFFIAFWSIAAVMRFAIDLDSNSGFQTGKVDNVGGHWELAAEFEAVRALAQGLPEEHFGKRQVLTQLARAFYQFDRG